MKRKEILIQLPVDRSTLSDFLKELESKLIDFGYFIPMDYYYTLWYPIHINLLVGNNKMLQDRRVRELLMEYLK